MNYQTINSTAKQTGLPACFLRSMLKQGKLPGFYSGSRFYCNIEKLLEMLSAQIGGVNT